MLALSGHPPGQATRGITTDRSAPYWNPHDVLTRCFFFFFIYTSANPAIKRRRNTYPFYRPEGPVPNIMRNALSTKKPSRAEPVAGRCRRANRPATRTPVQVTSAERGRRSGSDGRPRPISQALRANSRPTLSCSLNHAKILRVTENRIV